MAQATKQCGKCKLVKPATDFARSRRTKDRLAWNCNTCQAAYRRDWRERNRERTRELSRQHYLRHQEQRREDSRQRIAQHPERMKAYNAVAYAVQNGGLLRPEWCTACGEPGWLVAHHRDYLKPLEVEWLCRPCHGKLHADKVKNTQ